MVKSYKQKIIAQEHLDRYVCGRVIESLLTGDQQARMYPTKISDPVDLKCVLLDPDAEQKKQVRPFNVEIKERIKDEDTLDKFPFAELRVEKFNKMLAYNGSLRVTTLFYCVLLNRQKALLFNLSEIDWSQIKEVMWKVKDCEYDELSDAHEVPVYMIPYELAEAVVDCAQYYIDYTKEDFE